MLDEAAIKTYRYLRIGMVGTVLLLVASVGFERWNVDCWQKSISAYYYTPVRAIFVGGMLAIGLCLIIIKGSTPFEDTALNIAGMFAPIVAVVPTVNVGNCWSVRPVPLPVDEDDNLAAWVVANIDNNIKALLVAGLAGLIFSAVVVTISTGNPIAVAVVGDLGMRLSLAGALVFLTAGSAAFVLWGDFNLMSHSIAAGLMFTSLILAVVANALEGRHRRARRYTRMYTAIAVLMTWSAALILLFRSGWDHWLLVLEIIEIMLFAAFWLVQTNEHWRDTVRPDSASADSAPADSAEPVPAGSGAAEY